MHWLPKQPFVNDHDYCFSETKVKFINPGNVQIANPFLECIGGYGRNSPLPDPLDTTGQTDASYTMGASFYGTPTVGQYTTGPATVFLCLATGDYTLKPRIDCSTGGREGFMGSRSFTMTVGCKMVYDVEISTEGPGPIVNVTSQTDVCTPLASYALQGAVQADSVNNRTITDVSYTVTDSNGATTTGQLCGSCGQVFNLLGSFIPLQPCVNTVTITATDNQGLTGSAQFTIKLDSTPPVLTGCQDIIALATYGLNGAVVNYTVTALDYCDGPVQVNCALPPGSFFPIGQTVVTCTAKDKCGNPSTCQFNVTVTNPCPELVINGSFETPAIANNSFADVPTLAGWATTDAQGYFELWSGNFGGMVAFDGNQHLEINANDLVTTVSQVITDLSTNCPVTLCFNYRGRFGLAGGTPNNDFRVTVSGDYSFSVPLNPAAGGWFTFCTNFVPTSPTVTIAFRGAPHSMANGPGGAHIDNVSLTQCCPTNCPDLWVDVTATYPGPKLVHIVGPNTPCCGSDFVYHIKYGNKGGAPVSGATISFLYPASPLCSIVSIKNCQNTPYFVNSPPLCPPTISSSGLETFTLPTLNPGDNCNIGVRVHLYCDILAACTNQPPLLAQATILPLLPGDCNLLNNVSIHSRRPCCSYDPNDCTVSPQGCGPEGLIHRDQALTYLVQFQNEGSANAQVVVVRNDLDDDLDLSTLEDLGSSHEYYLQRNGRELLFIFPDIELPPQNVDEAASHGFVKFRVRPRTDAPAGTVITNRAAIYFDANDAVVTITTTNTLTEAPVPIAAFTVAPQPGLDGMTHDFTYAGGTAGASYLWYFGPDATPQTSTEANPTGVVFHTPGPHLVSLDTTLGGCEAEPAVQRVTVGRPQLSIERTAADVRLSWAGTGYRVQETTGLTAPIQWNPVTPPPSAAGGWNFVQLPQPNGSRFYQLVSVP